MKTWMKKRAAAPLAVLVLLCYAAAGTAYAQNGGQTYETGGFSSGSVYWLLVKVIFFLALIIGIFIVIMRAVAKKNKWLSSERSIRSLGGLGLGQNKSIQIVQIGHSLYVLGVGNDVELLSKIEDPEEIEYIQSRLHGGLGTDSRGFPTMKEWWHRVTGKQTPEEEVEVTPSFQAVFQEKMQRLTNRQKQMEDMMGEQSRDERLDQS